MIVFVQLFSFGFLLLLLFAVAKKNGIHDFPLNATFSIFLHSNTAYSFILFYANSCLLFAFLSEINARIHFDMVGCSYMYGADGFHFLFDPLR